jgi:hypothetical protein
MVTYHASFIPVPQDLLQRLCRAIHTFVAANRPVNPGAAAALFPGKKVCFRSAADGGIALVDIRAQILTLQAKVVGRLLEPEQLTWKAYFDHWLYRSTAWLAAQAPGTVSGRRQHIWQLGRFLLFSSFAAKQGRHRSASGSTCMPTSSCGPIACGSQKRSATTQSWVSHCFSTGRSQAISQAALCLGGLGQAWPGQDQPPARCRARPGASGSGGARARAHPSGCLASSLETAHPGAAIRRDVVRIAGPVGSPRLVSRDRR